MTVSTADQAAGAGVLGDDAAAVGGDLGEREAERLVGAARVEQGAEAAEVAAGGLGAALDDVAGDHGAGQLVVRRRGPSRSGRSAGPTTTEASVTRPVTTTSAPRVEGGGDAEGAEVGVRGQRLAVGGEAELSARSMRSSPSTCATCAVEALLGGELAQPGGEPGRVEPAGVRDDLHAPVEGEPEASSTCLRNVRA